MLPPTASFIRNQVVYHEKYTPFIMFAEEIPGSMNRELTSLTKCFQVTKGLTGRLLYKYLRLLTPMEKEEGIAYIGRLNPDIIHVHYGVDMIVFSGILKKLDIPVVVSFYGYDCTMFPKRFWGYGKIILQKSVFLHPKLNAVFAMSPDMVKDLVRLGCPYNLVKIHYYGTECKEFWYDRKYIDRNIINFTIISGLSPKKGHLFLLESWCKANYRVKKQIQLTIVGSGCMKSDISSYIEDKKLQNVCMVSHVNYGSAEHFNILKNTDVFIHPSITSTDGDKEGIPGAIIEAMASGLPVISTLHAGIPHIIQNGRTGILVEEGSSDQLAEAIILLSEEHEVRKKLGIAAQEYALKNLNIAIKEIELEDLYDKIILSGRVLR